MGMQKTVLHCSLHCLQSGV
ncbi:hypothetical protein Zm00014a_018121 [Zea mays]|uniref:Uncharacterized protein n=1 Tax=Zea mays TaxID=4577 RepID=A0A3L6DEW7_MAIZE|nr:hypothetical protein Zm00014a_018121 [Zea mays]